MKRYTKKMTYSLQAIGLLACAPVVSSPTSRARSDCKKITCPGYFVKAANDKKLTGVIKKDEVKVKVSTNGVNCYCEYTGDLDIEKNKYFDNIAASKDGTFKHLKKVSKHAASKKCKKSKEVCLT